MPFAPSYSASKHGVVGFSRSMTECAHSDSVRINCICPEYVNTNMVRGALDILETSALPVSQTGLIE